MFAEPAPSSGDLHFRLFGIPVRVSPMFWVMSLVLGLSPTRSTPPAHLLIWIAVAFVSILVHELGHAFVQRYFGGQPWITLYGMGGLASCDDCDRRTSSQILISLAGPVAGFLFALLVAAVMVIAGRTVGIDVGKFDPHAQDLPDISWLEFPLSTVYWATLPTSVGNKLVGSLFTINILWGLVNLLPVYPLDGGRIAREIATIRDAPAGIVWSLRLSIATAIGMALFALAVWHSLFVPIMFGYIAYLNYQTLQHYQQSRW
jgi:Zn-dependent protease